MAMLKRIVYTTVIIFLAFSCKTGNNPGGNADFEIPDSLLNQGELQVSEEAMEDIVQNVSSPVEMAALIKSLGIPYSQKYLASVDNADNYNTSFEQALGLGVYGADLGYLNMYNKTTSVIDYISVIKDLADDIKVGQFL